MQKIVGVIPDLQIPGHLEDALPFIRDTFSEQKVTDVIFIGDIVDHHYIGFHQNEVDALNPIEEGILAKEELARWVKAFPKAKICRGNHDDLPMRVARAMGLPPDFFLKSLNAVYDLPDAWEWSERWDIDEVIYEHGLGSNGMYGAKNTAIKLGSSYVQGHTHAHAAVFDIPKARYKMAAMNVGCLMDSEKYNARYAKLFFKVPVSLGCGIVYAHDEMKFIPKR